MNFRYIYGPVSSWRLGRSLGIDPISRQEKTCTFDCVYCQVGKTQVFPDKREVFVATKDLIQEIRSLPVLQLDTITFAGNGEPTLAKNLGEMIREIKAIRKEKISVITNASLLGREDVQEDLSQADLVVAKLDAVSDDLLGHVNRPMADISADSIIQGLKSFRDIYRGRLAVQVMFIASNKKDAEGIAGIVKEIRPDEVEVNTPLRENEVKPLPEKDILEIAEKFKKICGNAIGVRHVYENPKTRSRPLCQASTEQRRGREAV